MYYLNDVRVVIADQRMPVSTNSTTVAYYKPKVLSIHDYYTFGWEKQLTTVNPYPFNYQGQLFDRELGWQYYRYRNYDPLIARFWQVEPLVDKYPWLGYVFTNNKVTYSIEREGLEDSVVIIKAPGGKAISMEVVKYDKVGSLGHGTGIKVEYKGKLYYFFSRNEAKDLYDLIAFYEGKKNVVYKDPSGYLTVGVGHKVTKDEESKYKEGSKISEEEIQSLFKKDVENVKKALERNLGEKFKNLSKWAKDALISLAFNIGPNRKAFANIVYDPGNILKYAYSGGKFYRGLLKRRVAEFLLWKSRKYLKVNVLSTKNAKILESELKKKQQSQDKQSKQQNNFE